MTNAQSKCLPVLVSCHQYVHPWTESCWNSAAGQIIHSLGNSSKIYTVVYMLSLLMRGRIPTIRDLIKTFLGIMQSTGFLVTNGCCYLIFACVLRNLLGEFKFWTIAYGPAFIASFFAILVERPTRRPLLSLYVANLATETIWRMAEVRKIVRPIPHGETLIFGLSTSILLYLYKRGLHKNLAKDSLFNVLKFIVGKDEEGKLNCNHNSSQNNNNNNNNNGYDADEDDCNSSNSSSNENQSNRSNKIDNGDDVNSYNNNNNSNNNRRGRSRSRNYSNSNNSDSEFYADAANATTSTTSTDGGADDDGIGIVNRSKNLNESDENIEQGQKRGLELDDDGIPRFYNNINYGDANDDTDYRGNNNNDKQQQQQHQQQSSRNENFCNNRNGMQKFSFISNLLKIYENYLNTIKTMPKHKSCPHSNGCLYYSICGGLKLFGVGAGLQIALKLALQISKIIQFKLNLRKTVFNKNTIKLGIFLGGFSFLFKASSCTFRHIFGKDDPLYAIPAGLISSVAFTKYPDVTIALYVMWKMLQITYNMGIDAGYLPKVPGFTIFLYCASTATLFHAAALEAEAVRPSYWKFLSSNSGGRVNAMDRRAFDVYGLNSHQQAQNIQKLTNTINAKISFPIS